MGDNPDLPNDVGTPPAGSPPAGSPPPGGNPPAGDPASAGSPPAAGEPWYSTIAGLDADTQKWISDKKFVDVSTALKSGMHADHVARDRNVLSRPAADKLAEWDGWKDLGWTEDRKAYDVTAPDEIKKDLGEYNGAFELAFVDAAHKARVPAQQAKSILSDVLGYIKGVYEQAGIQGAKATTDLNTALDKEWGADAAKNRELSQRAARALGVPVDDMAALEKVMGSPGLVKMFHKIGSMMGEDKLIDPKTPGSGGLTASGAKAELQRLNADAGHVKALGDATNPLHQAAKDARQRLLEIIAKG